MSTLEQPPSRQSLFPLNFEETEQLHLTYDEAISLIMAGNVVDAGLKIKALKDTLSTIDETDSTVLTLRNKLTKTIETLKAGFVLSKSSYMKGCQCRKLLYLNKHSPSLRDPISRETQARFNSGHSFEDIFREQHFPTGKSIETILKGFVQFYPYLTELFIHEGVSTLFEAAFVHNETIVLADVLHKNHDGTWELIEIKNSKFLKEVFIHDAALQYHVISNKLPGLNKVQIVLNQNGGPQYHDITEEVLCRQHAIANRVDHFREILGQDFVPDIETGYQCYKPYKCDFFGYCHGVKSRY